MRASHPRVPWWVHLTFLVLILGSAAVSVLTGNPLYALIGCPAGYAIGSALSTTRGRHRAVAILRNRYVWLLVAGAAFATAAATVATLAVTR